MNQVQTRPSTAVTICVVLALAVGSVGVLQAQTSALGPAAIEATDQAVPVVFFNRQVAVLRARIVGRGPAERAENAVRVLDQLVAEGITSPIERRPFDGGVLIIVGSRVVLGLAVLDIDELSGETVDGVATEVSEHLRNALAAASEARTPGIVLRAGEASLFALVFAALLLWIVSRSRRAVERKLTLIAERTAEKTGIVDIEHLRASRLLDVQRALTTSVAGALDLFIVYTAVGVVLRQFPYTRPWGDSMRGFLIDLASTIGLGIAGAMPGLLTAAVIFLIARGITRVVRFWFAAVEGGRITSRYIFPDTAQPTRRLVVGLIWVFAVVVAYPYLPGSQTDAFKGVSVLLGIMLTVGSTGLVNQIMSSFMITYSRSLRVGDFVKIGSDEGTVIHLGVLSVKIRTIWGEEVTIPNAVVVAQTTMDYSQRGSSVFTRTSVTIGYDTPWRQVSSLLLTAAGRTAGLRREPKPTVLQTALSDFYVEYTLLVSLEKQELRAVTMNELHANIQDLFNEYGVQIMSPHYLQDPSRPKLVAQKDWFAPPAKAARASDS